MTKLQALRNFLFRLRHGFRGVPFSFQGHTLRMDESLRRWNPDVERDMQSALCEYLRAGDIFVDVGANFGLHTLLGASCVGPSGHVFAFEPVPANGRLLRKNVSLNAFGARVTVLPEAVSDRAGGFVELHGATDDLSFAASLQKTAGAGASCRAPATTLDVSLEDRPGAVRLIKIDVEGAEHLVLRGARQIILEDRPLLLVEVHSFALPAFGSSAEAVRQELQQLGYWESPLDTVEGADGSYFHALYHPAGPTADVPP